MGFLEEIVRETRRSLNESAYGEGLLPEPPVRSISFRQSIERDRERGALVAEYKRVSPGHAKPNLPERTVKAFVSLLESAEPTAYSCLATAPRFEGSPTDVAELAASTARPVLFKDFIVDRRQVDAAARAGAGAILLIARLETEKLLAEPLSTLSDAAHDRGLEVLLEFHGRAELTRVENVRADVYGVNTRNLDTLKLDRRTATKTLREAGRMGLRPLLGLSGVATAADARNFWNEGVDGILVGSAVARAANPSEFLSSLRRSPGKERP